MIPLLLWFLVVSVGFLFLVCVFATTSRPDHFTEGGRHWLPEKMNLTDAPLAQRRSWSRICTKMEVLR
jgi:hypothetical protein